MEHDPRIAGKWNRRFSEGDEFLIPQSEQRQEAAQSWKTNLRLRLLFGVCLLLSILSQISGLSESGMGAFVSAFFYAQVIAITVWMVLGHCHIVSRIILGLTWILLLSILGSLDSSDFQHIASGNVHEVHTNIMSWSTTGPPFPSFSLETPAFLLTTSVLAAFVLGSRRSSPSKLAVSDLFLVIFLLGCLLGLFRAAFPTRVTPFGLVSEVLDFIGVPMILAFQLHGFSVAACSMALVAACRAGRYRAGVVIVCLVFVPMLLGIVSSVAMGYVLAEPFSLFFAAIVAGELATIAVFVLCLLHLSLLCRLQPGD